MKTLQIMMLVLAITGSVVAQDMNPDQVPSVILNSFKKDFPKASDIEWERQGNQYQVEFKIGFFSDFEAWYDTSGKLIRYSEDLWKRDLPDAVKATIKRDYPGYHIDDAKKLVENNTVSYWLEIEKGRQEHKLLLNANGNLISTPKK
ncbi:MAG: PepSY-like domain-containing protein [Xanthomarina gelatinilytica]|uniref:PepSY-like domain-containing protein n=1 Tax=Xanthomarina gelatinilytica TaxID=1137281 RepID=UPI003A8BA72B